MIEYVALKHYQSEYGEWCICPKEYWEKYAHIPDTKAKLNIPFMDEVSDHTLQATDKSDGRSHLENAGIKIIENPVWYFEKPGYIDRDIE